MRRVVSVWLPHFHTSLAPVLGPGPHPDPTRAAIVAARAGSILHRSAPWVEFLPGAADELLADLGPGTARDGIEMCRRIAGELEQELGLTSRIGLATGKLAAHAAARQSVVSGQWAVGSGQWSVVSGQWSVVSGQPSASEDSPQDWGGGGAERRTPNAERRTPNAHSPNCVPEGMERMFLAPLPVEVLWDVGSEAAEQLRRWGVTTLGQLASLPPPEVSRVLGSAAPVLQRLAAGLDHRRVAEWMPPASETAASLLAADEALPALLERLAGRLVRRRLPGRGCRIVSVTLHLSGGRRLFAAEPLNEPALFAAKLNRIAERLLGRLQPRMSQAVLAELEAGWKLRSPLWTRPGPILDFEDLSASILTGHPLPAIESGEIGVEAVELAVSVLELHPSSHGLVATAQPAFTARAFS